VKHALRACKPQQLWSASQTDNRLNFQQFDRSDSASALEAPTAGHSIVDDLALSPPPVGSGNDDTILRTRLSIIAEQEQALEAYFRHRRNEGTWQWAPPRLGVLRQHQPIRAHIPDYYGLKLRLPADPPVLSIITPTRNQGAFIERTLRSVLDQGYTRLEYIVQDGGSEDETLDILGRYRRQLGHIDSGKDNGIGQGLNRGFEHATGDILAYLNSDDLLLKGSLHFVAAFFAEHPDIDVVYGHRLIVDSRGDEVGRWVLPLHDDAVMPWVDYIPQETLFWRRQIWERVGSQIDESFRFAVDWELLLRFRQAGARFARLPRFLGAFRVHADQKTSRQINDIGMREMQRLRDRYLGRAVSGMEIADETQPYLQRHVVYHKLYRLGALRY
jgi:GT2 family glycosyltransferase